MGTTYLENLGDNTAISLSKLAMKTVMLLALTRPSRSGDLLKLDLKYVKQIPEGILLQTTGLQQAKYNLNNTNHSQNFFSNLPLCPVWALKEYIPRIGKTPKGEGRCTDNRAFPCQLSNHTGHSYILNNSRMVKQL